VSVAISHDGPDIDVTFEGVPLFPIGDRERGLEGIVKLLEMD